MGTSPGAHLFCCIRVLFGKMREAFLTFHFEIGQHSTLVPRPIQQFMSCSSPDTCGRSRGIANAASVEMVLICHLGKMPSVTTKLRVHVDAGKEVCLSLLCWQLHPT